jgi:hypothetical protein
VAETLPTVTIDKQVAVHQANSADDIWYDVGPGTNDLPNALAGEQLDWGPTKGMHTGRLTAVYGLLMRSRWRAELPQFHRRH